MVVSRVASTGVSMAALRVDWLVVLKAVGRVD